MVGAGKTTLVRGLARELDCLDLEERFEENPYLERFYARPPAWAFKSYVFFLQRTLADYLRARAAEQGGCQERVLEEHLLVFGEEFRARGYLDQDEFDLLRDLTLTAVDAVPVPDLLIQIDISPEQALRRLKERGNPAEGGIGLDYLAALNERYALLVGDWRGPRLRLDAADLDFREPGCVSEVAGRVERLLPPATTRPE